MELSPVFKESVTVALFKTIQVVWVVALQCMKRALSLRDGLWLLSMITVGLRYEIQGPEV